MTFVSLCLRVRLRKLNDWMRSAAAPQPVSFFPAFLWLDDQSPEFTDDDMRKLRTERLPCAKVSMTMFLLRARAA